MKRALASALVALLQSCGDPIDDAAVALLEENDAKERTTIINALDPEVEPRRLMVMLDEVLARDAEYFVTNAAVRKIGAITDPSLRAERDALLFRWLHESLSPGERSNLLESLMRPDADMKALGSALEWCLLTYPDPVSACVGFREEAGRMGDAGASMFADVARRGDRVVAYYAAAFSCKNLRSFTTTQPGREAVRDTLAAAQALGLRDGDLAGCVDRLSKVMPDHGLDPMVRGPCALRSDLR